MQQTEHLNSDNLNSLEMPKTRQEYSERAIEHLKDQLSRAQTDNRKAILLHRITHHELQLKKLKGPNE